MLKAESNEDESWFLACIEKSVSNLILRILSVCSRHAHAEIQDVR